LSRSLKPRNNKRRKQEKSFGTPLKIIQKQLGNPG
jgi:hypothetical protein